MQIWKLLDHWPCLKHWHITEAITSLGQTLGEAMDLTNECNLDNLFVHIHGQMGDVRN